MKNLNKKKLVALLLISFLLVCCLFLFFIIRIKTNKQKSLENVTKLNTDLSQTVGGVIVEDGFEINYIEDEKKIYIKITSEPFLKYKGDAIKYLKDRGINLCDHNYFIQAGREVVNPNEEQKFGGSCKAN